MSLSGLPRSLPEWPVALQAVDAWEEAQRG